VVFSAEVGVSRGWWAGGVRLKRAWGQSAAFYSGLAKGGSIVHAASCTVTLPFQFVCLVSLNCQLGFSVNEIHVCCGCGVYTEKHLSMASVIRMRNGVSTL